MVHAEKALAFDHKSQQMIMVGQQDIRKVLANPSNVTVEWTLIGSVNEFIQGSKDLKQAISETSRGFREEKVRKIGREILEGIAEIHRVRVGGQTLIHRDIKPENILLTQKGHVKVFDYGFSRLIGPKRRRYSYRGTPIYVPPEFFTRKAYDGRADSFAVGVTLFQMATKRLPYKLKDMATLIHNKIRGSNISERPLLARKSPQLIDIIGKLGEPDPEQRITVGEALNHPFFSKKQK